MALNSRSSLHPKWPYHNRRVDSGFQVCTATIYYQNLQGRSYNATTNTWDSTATSIWSGNARIQPLSNSSERMVTTNDTFVRQVQVHINFAGNTIADIRPGYYMIINTSPLDANLTKFIYVVRSVMNSSNPWQRTLICEVDMESDPSA